MMSNNLGKVRTGQFNFFVILTKLVVEVNEVKLQFGFTAFAFNFATSYF